MLRRHQGDQVVERFEVVDELGVPGRLLRPVDRVHRDVVQADGLP